MNGPDVDRPMGNAELRLTLANIASEVVDTKAIAIETHTQAKATNGRVTYLEKQNIKCEAVEKAVVKLTQTSTWSERSIWISMGAIPLLTVWALWLTKAQLERPAQFTPAEQSVQIQAAVNAAFKNQIDQ